MGEGFNYMQFHTMQPDSLCVYEDIHCLEYQSHSFRDKDLVQLDSLCFVWWLHNIGKSALSSSSAAIEKNSKITIEPMSER